MLVKEYVSAMFMDLSKAFETIHPDLMIAKFFRECSSVHENFLKNR